MNHKLNVNLQEKAVLVMLNCAFTWGTVTDRRMTDEVTDDTGATHGSVRVRKTLLPKAAGKLVAAVQSSLSDFYQYHTRRTYGTSIRGQRVMPSAFYMDYMQKFGEAMAAGRGALADLVNGYEAAIEQAKPLLGAAFNRDDYPPVEEIERYYALDVKFLPLPKGDHIMGALGEAAACDVDTFVGEMLKTAAEDARKRLRSAVEKMAERLTTKDSKIYDTMPAAINDLANELPVIAGITDDAELAAMVKEVKDTLSGYSGDDFRKSEALKSDVGKAALAMLKKMGG